MNSTWKILIVADEPVVRFGLARLLSQSPDIEVCGEAKDASDALRATELLRPDLALIGCPLETNVLPGFFSQLKTVHPLLRIVFGTRSDDHTLYHNLMRAGADGCIHWGESLPQRTGYTLPAASLQTAMVSSPSPSASYASSR
jgi:DNA-binding NarL/FixJ family response regulator